MITTLVVSIAVRLAAAAWCLVLWRRLREWSIALLMLILLLSAARQGTTLLERSQVLEPEVGGSATALLGLAVSVLALLAVLVAGRLITARRRAEEKERRTARFYRSLLDNASDVVHVVSCDGTVRYISPSVERLLGRTPRELVGTSVFTLVHGEDAPALREMLGRARAGGTLGPARELRLRHRDGSWRVFESAGANLAGDPHVAGIVINSLDVTARKHAEVALRQSYERLTESQKLEALSTLARGVVHDFNNVLTAIGGYTQLTLPAVPSGTVEHRNLTEVLAAVERGARLADQILVFGSRTESERTRVALTTVVTDVLRMLRPLIPPAIQIQQRLEPAGTVLANASQMQQIVMNLCTNAARAMGDGEGALEVTLAPTTVAADQALRLDGMTPGACLRLSVRDTGCGIAQEVLPHIFEPLFTTNAGSGGTGMGLAVVRRIVRAHAGGVAVESEPGRGTTVHVYLPQVDGARRAHPGSKPPEARDVERRAIALGTGGA